MINFGYDYYCRLSTTASSATNKVTTTVSLPPYIMSYGDYTIRYLQMTMDQTALLNDYPKYKFSSITIYYASSFSYYLTYDMALPNMNTFGGISQYHFYNNQ